MPASFVTDDKSTWKHVFKARSGGVAGLHAIDDVLLQYYNSGLVNTGTTYSQSIAQTTTYYVSETSAAGCTGPRVAVTATVNQPDTLVASSNGPVCIGSPVTLTATVTSGGNNNTYGLTWSAAAAASGITGSTSGGTASYGSPASITVTPTAAGTYNFTLNGTDASGALTCSVTSTVSVVVNALPVIDSVSANKTTICAGTSVNLQGYSAVGQSGPTTQPAGYCSVSNLGTSSTSYFNSFSTTGAQQNITNSSSGYSTNGYGNFNNLSVIASTGQTVSFNTALTGTTVGVAIWVDWNRSGTFESTEQVYVTSGYVSTASGSFTVPATASFGTTRMRIMMDYYNSVPADPCAISSSGQGEVEDYTFVVRNINTINPDLTYTWNPGNISNSTGTATVSPTTTTTYTMSVANTTTGCAALATQSVTVTVVPVSATATKSVSGASCSGSPVTLTAIPVGQGPFTFVWTLNGQTTSLGVLSTLTVSPTATTTYSVTVKDACLNAAIATVTVDVNALPTVSIVETSPISICAPNTQTLTANPSVTTVRYQWMLNGVNISGATSATYAAGSTGSYTVKVTDTTIGCTSAASAAVVLTINNQPATFAITPASASISYGGSVALSGTGANTTTNNVDALAETFDGSATGWSVLSSATSPAGGVWQYKTAPYTADYSAGGTAFTNFSTTQGGKFAMAFSDQGGAGTNDSTMISSPVFNTTNYTSANLVFEQLYYNFSGDVAKVQISTNGGTAWTDLATYSTNKGTVTAGSQATTTTTISMASYLNQTNLKVRFFYRSNYGYYWVVDNVKVTGTTVVAPSSWTWSPSTGLNTASGTSVTAAPTQTTTYTLTATNFGGCIRTQNVKVRVRPTAVISGTQFLCNGSSANLSVAVTGNGPWSGTLSNGATFSGSTSPITVSVSPSTTTTYTVATLNDATDTSTATQLTGSAVVTVRPRPTGVISGTTSLANGTVSTTLSIAVTGTGSWSGTLSNGQSFSGSTSPISVIVSPTTTTTYTIATLVDANCTSVSGDLTGSATVYLRPAGVITGTQPVCTGSTTATLSIAVAGNGPWSGTLSNGATFSGSTSPITVSVTPTSTTVYTIATLIDASSSAQAGDLTGSATVTVYPRPTGAITGNATICNGSSTNLSIAVTGNGPWSGTLSDGSSFSGSTSPIVTGVSPSATTTYTIATLVDAHCTSVSGDMSGSALVNVNPRPTGVISGGATYCAGLVGTTQLSIVVTGNGPWSGTLSNGTTFSGSTSPISVTVPAPNASTVYTIATLVDSRCTAISADKTGSATVTINARATGVISGTAQICGGEIANITLNFTGVGSWSGTITAVTPYGGVNTSTTVIPFTSTNATLVIPVTPSVNTTYTITTLTDANCTSLTADVSGSAVITVNPFVPEPITGEVNVCPYVGTSTVLPYTVPAVAGALSYTWTFGPSSSLTTIQLVNASGAPITYNYVNGYTTTSNTVYVKVLTGFVDAPNKQIRVKVTTRCGASLQRIFYLAAQRPGTPNTIVPSSTNVCPSIGTNVPITYTIPKVLASQHYVWTITTGGVTNTTTAHMVHPYSGENDTVVVVTFDNTFATSVISVYTTNDCGTSANSRSLTITRNNPSAPGLISGPANACEFIGTNGTNATYSVAVISNVDTYTWTLPSGATNITGQGTNTVSFRYPAGFVSGTVSVIASNGCGTGGVRTLNISVLTPTYPGQIDVINTQVCPNREYTYTIASLPQNTTSMLWTVPASGTITAGQGTTSITVSYPSTVINGLVTVQSVNNCGVSLTRNTTIKLGACAGFTSNTNPTVKGNTVITGETPTMSVKVFPNPTTSNFNLQVITADNEEIKVRVLDIQGRFIKEVIVSAYQTINLGAELKSGAYMIEVRQGKNLKTTRVLKF